MSAWLAGTTILCACLVPCAAVCLRGKNVFDRLVAPTCAGY